MKLLLLLFLMFALLSCSKKTTEPDCVDWIVNYYQATSDHTTVTSNYYPYERTEQYCGSQKQYLQKGKIETINQVSGNLYNYKIYLGPKN
jgi:hypothetical protein